MARVRTAEQKAKHAEQERNRIARMTPIEYRAYLDRRNAQAKARREAKKAAAEQAAAPAEPQTQSAPGVQTVTSEQAPAAPATKKVEGAPAAKQPRKRKPLTPEQRERKNARARERYREKKHAAPPKPPKLTDAQKRLLKSVQTLGFDNIGPDNIAKFERYLDFMGSLVSDKAFYQMLKAAGENYNDAVDARKERSINAKRIQEDFMKWVSKETPESIASLDEALHKPYGIYSAETVSGLMREYLTGRGIVK